MFKDMKTIRILQKEEIITHSLLENTSILNAKSSTIMVISLVNVYFQSIP
jgi:hypothetical protein